jgi:hypothetical protein
VPLFRQDHAPDHRRVLRRVAFAVLLASPGASAVAQSTTAPSAITTRTLTVTGNAPQVCTMQTGRIQTGSLNNVSGIEGDTLRIVELADPQTLAARASSATISFSAVCNYPHSLRIESQNNGLWPTDGRAGAAAGGFAYAVPYQARLQWGGASGALDANAKVRRISEQRLTIDDATAGDVQLRLDIADGASNLDQRAPLAAGAYGDTIRIFLEPR